MKREKIKQMKQNEEKKRKEKLELIILNNSNNNSKSNKLKRGNLSETYRHILLLCTDTNSEY